LNHRPSHNLTILITQIENNSFNIFIKIGILI